MLDIKLLNKIKPGDEVLYDYFWEGNEEWHEVLKVARRSGFDENGNIDLDDYITVKDASMYEDREYDVDEVCYADIKAVKFKEE